VKTFGLDTNVVLRLVLDDHPAQHNAALTFGAGLGREYNAFMPLIALLELDWALRAQYGFQKKDVTATVERLLRTRGLSVENHTLVLKALGLVTTHNVDFADALIACRSQEEGCDAIKTFNQKAAKRIPGMELLS
jgi:predicted nucleic-acid-binding protein